MFFRKFHIRLLQGSRAPVQNYSSAMAPLSRQGLTSYPEKKTSEDLFREALESVNPTKPQDWDQVKHLMLNGTDNRLVREENIDGLVMLSISKRNRLDLAKSYFSYLKANGSVPNLATTGRYLSILYANSKEKVAKTTEDEILAICSEIVANNPVLDSKTLDHMARALSLTKDWKKGLELMEEIKITSSVSDEVYCAVAAAAFRNKEGPLAWKLLQESMTLNRAISGTPFRAYLVTLKRQRKRENILKSIEKIFTFYQQSEIAGHEDVVDDIIQTFNLGKKTTVKFSGICESCGTKLEKLELSDDEFVDLRRVFFENAIIGKDIFIKSNPEEMARFQEFIADMHQYDVVLDGLNVAYSTGTKCGPQRFSETLANVVLHFAQQNKTVLVLGRVHMTRWPRENWNTIKRNATVFLTQNISEDDPYLLYCALKSGKQTIVVTRDLMRSHKFLLKDRKYKVLFERWLTQRQFFPSIYHNRNQVNFKIPPNFSAIAQVQQGKWHIPYTPRTDTERNEAYHRTWMCLDSS